MKCECYGGVVSTGPIDAGLMVTLERCDQCLRFDSDVEAGLAVAEPAFFLPEASTGVYPFTSIEQALGLIGGQYGGIAVTPETWAVHMWDHRMEAI